MRRWFGDCSSVVARAIVGRYLQAWDLRTGRRLPLTGYVMVQLEIGGKERAEALRCSCAPVDVVERRGSGAGGVWWAMCAERGNGEERFGKAGSVRATMCTSGQTKRTCGALPCQDDSSEHRMRAGQSCIGAMVRRASCHITLLYSVAHTRSNVGSFVMKVVIADAQRRACRLGQPCTAHTHLTSSSSSHPCRSRTPTAVQTQNK